MRKGEAIAQDFPPFSSCDSAWALLVGAPPRQGCAIFAALWSV